MFLSVNRPDNRLVGNPEVILQYLYPSSNFPQNRVFSNSDRSFRKCDFGEFGSTKLPYRR